MRGIYYRTALCRVRLTVLALTVAIIDALNTDRPILVFYVAPTKPLQSYG